MERTGAQIVLACLKEHDVDTVFGYPGGAVIPLYHALFDQLHEFTHIRTAHEQGAVHAADGYARTTGKPGVVFATSGPGATNTVTGIASAYMDSSPLVVITGQVPSPLLGKDSFQEIDITGMTVPITKHNYLVRDIARLEDVLHEAFQIAQSGRPGPVLVDITKDVFTARYSYKGMDPGHARGIAASPALEGELEAAVAMLKASKRPVLYAGGGVGIGGAAAELMELAEKADIPVVNTLMGLGSIPRNHPLSLGLVGMHGFPETNFAISSSDLIIAVGARFSDRVIGDPKAFAPNAKIIHLDIDQTEFSKNIQVDLKLRGEVSVWLKGLTTAIDPMKHERWRMEIRGASAPIPSSDHVLSPRFILQAVAETLPDAAVVTDVGQHQMWTAQYWPFSRTRQFITSGGLGTMGFGMGAAVGACFRKPGASAVLVTGDGSFRMNCNELATVSETRVPLVIVLMNNRALGMVRQWQKLFQDKRYAATCVEDTVDYVKLADSYGIQGFRIQDPAALKRALAWEGIGREPVLLDCRISKDEDVWPIVPPGQPINRFLLG